MSLISMIFIGVQAGIIGLFILVHFLIGLKRGLAKTSWYFLMHVVLVLIIFTGIGFIPVHFFISQERAYQVSLQVTSSNPQMVETLEALFNAGAFEIVVAFADFIGKIILFIILYWLFRWLFMMLLAGLTWKKITKNSYEDQPKKRFLGGMVGILRGSFSGLIALLPVLVMINALASYKQSSENQMLDETLTDVVEANEYNFIKPFNTLKVGHTGLADATFDLAFSTRIRQNHIKWRIEFSWMSEAIIQSNTLNQQDDGFNFTVEDLSSMDTLIQNISNSDLLNLAVSPGINYSFSMLFKDSIPSDVKATYFDTVSKTPVKLNKDIVRIYQISKQLLEIADFKTWQEMFKNPEDILALTDTQKDKLTKALEGIFDLDIFLIADATLTLGLNHKDIKTYIPWKQSDEEKDNVIHAFLKRLENYEGNFVASTGKDALKVMFDVFFNFPSDIEVSKKLVKVTDVLFGHVNPLLIGDASYHAWITQTVDKLSTMDLMDVLMEPAMDYIIYQLEQQMTSFSKEELTSFISILKANFSTADDLNRELLWATSLYEKLTLLYTNSPDVSNDVIQMLDQALSKENGRTAFNDFVDHLLKGQTVSVLTKNLSSALIKRYVTEPLSLTQPLYRALNLKTFDFNHELHIVKDLVLDLYKVEGFSLNVVLSEEDTASKLMPFIIDYLSKHDTKDVLDSDIIYSLIDYQLTNIQVLEIPDIARTIDGNYENWIKKTELEILFDLIVSMDLDIDTLFNGQDQNDALIEKMIDFTKTVENRNKLLSSDILYFNVSHTLDTKAKDFLPAEAFESDTADPYFKMVKKTELDKLLQVLHILEIKGLDHIEQALNINALSNQNMSEIVGLNSVIIRHEITKQINALEALDIPNQAYEDDSKKYLKYDEIESITQMLETLKIEAKDLNDLDDMQALLSKINVKDFIAVSYQEKLVIRSFISMGIKESIANLPAEVIDANGLIQTKEINQLFKAVDAISEPNDTMDTFKDKLDPNMITFNQVSLIIDASNSVIILHTVSKEVLNAQQIKKLNLDDSIYYNHKKEMLSQTEFKHLMHAFIELKNNDTDILMQTLNQLNIETLTLDKVNRMFSHESEVIRYLISDELTKESLDIPIEPHTLSAGIIMRSHMNQLLNTLINTLGNQSTITGLSNLYDTFTLSQFADVALSDSVIIKHLITVKMDASLGVSTQSNTTYITNELKDVTYDMMHKTELTHLNQALIVLSKNQPQVKFSNLIGQLDTLTLQQILEVLAVESVLIQRKISDEFIETIGKEKIHGETIETTGFYIKNQALLESMTVLADNFDTEIPVTNLAEIFDTLTLMQLKALTQANDPLIHGISSDYLKNALTDALRTRVFDKDYGHYEGYLPEIIRKIEIEGLIDMALSVGSDGLITDVAQTFSKDALSIQNLLSFKTKDSVILKSLISDAILNSVNHSTYPIDKRGYGIDLPYGIDEYKDLSFNEIKAIIGAIEVINQNDLSQPLSEIFSNISLSNIDLGTVKASFAEGSWLIQIYLSRAITDTLQNLGQIDIYDLEAKDVNDVTFSTLLKKVEISNLLDAFDALNSDTSKSISGLANQVSGTKLSSIDDALNANSIIFQRLVSSALKDANIDTQESWLDQNLNQTDLIQLEEIKNLSKALQALNIENISEANSDDALSKITENIKDIDEDAFKAYIDYQEPLIAEDEGLTIVKSYLISKLDHPLFSVRNREELLQRYKDIKQLA